MSKAMQLVDNGKLYSSKDFQDLQQRDNLQLSPTPRDTGKIILFLLNLSKVSIQHNGMSLILQRQIETA